VFVCVCTTAASTPEVTSTSKKEKQVGKKWKEESGSKRRLFV
jgi:hypothetical protein